MKFLKLPLALLLILAFAIVSLAQDEPRLPLAAENENPKIATLIDEFGLQGDCELGARVDNFFIQLNNTPRAKGYVISYASPDILPSQYKTFPMIARIRRVMAFRKYDEERLVFINGGFRDATLTDLYLVPQGAAPPKPTDTIPAPTTPKGTFLWDRSYLQSEESYQNFEEFIRPEVKAKEEDENRLASIQDAIEASADPERAADAAIPGNDQEEPADEETLSPEEIRELKFDWANKKFSSEIAERANATGVMIFYIDDQYYDLAEVRRFIEEGRDIIAADAKLHPNRIRVVFGGYRDSAQLEYYIVPKGGKSPKPKPEVRSIPVPPDTLPG